jgi:four helix bundle protein
MDQISKNEPIYDLEERTFKFARDVRLFVRTLPLKVANREDGKQLINSSGSVDANYREANDSLSRKDLKLRLKTSRKEAKESAYWLKLIVESNTKNSAEGKRLYKESLEIEKLLSALLDKIS